MCGRVNEITPAHAIATQLSLIFLPDWPVPRYNLAPTQQILAVRHNEDGKRFAVPMRWGLLPSWVKYDKPYATFNARSETIKTALTFRAAFKSRRCLIPVSGFFEWQKLPGNKKQPWNIFRADGEQLVMAGLWESWKKPDKTQLESCTIITTSANSFMSPLHNRMPVILGREHWDLWLNPKESPSAIAQDLLQPCPDDWLDKFRVSTIVGNVKNESPQCVESID